MDPVAWVLVAPAQKLDVYEDCLLDLVAERLGRPVVSSKRVPKRVVSIGSARVPRAIPLGQEIAPEQNRVVRVLPRTPNGNTAALQISAIMKGTSS